MSKVLLMPNRFDPEVVTREIDMQAKVLAKRLALVCMVVVLIGLAYKIGAEQGYTQGKEEGALWFTSHIILP